MATEYRYNKFTLIFKCRNKGQRDYKYYYVHHTNGHWLYNDVARKCGGVRTVWIFSRETNRYLGHASSPMELEHKLKTLRP